MSRISGTQGGRRCRRLVLLAGVLAAAPSAVSAQGTLEGVVRAAGTGQALAGAQVSLPDLELGAVTDPGGRYRIADVPVGTHQVVVGFIGYGVEVREVVVSSGETTRLDVELSQAAVALEGLVAVGSRARPRAVTASPVPVDAIASTDFVNQGPTDLSSLLRNIAPSYNVNIQPIADAATISRPANLRNLAPDHTLVLVNGKRRHRAAAIAWFGNGVADGAQGPDIAVIPAVALRQVEVLRDGASAQYGSDAIAGVMNFQLRDDRTGGSLEFRAGGHPLAADGHAHTVSGNVGLPLGSSGFVNLSGEYGAAMPTSRSVQRDDAMRLIAAGNTAVATPAQVWGSPKVEDDLKLWANFGAFAGDRTQFYGHANYASKRVTGGFYFRNPNERQAIYSNDRGKTLLVADMLDAADGVLDGSANCPVVPIVGGVPDPAAFQQVKDDPNCFSFQEILPGGYTPQFGGDYLDASVVAGIKGETRGGLNWDASAGWGANELEFFIHQSTNASLGPATPTSFDLGLYGQQEINFNADLSYAANDMVNLAGGAEWRRERFDIGQGQEESWVFGPLAAQGFRAATDGFPGFGPLAARGPWSRSNYAAYGDAELRDPAGDRWTLGGAVRVENFSDFGIAANWKLAGRYELADGFGLRASASTGFRAPTPGQQNAYNVTTEFDRELNAPVNKATIASTSEVAALRGGKQLQPEESVNAALGAVASLGRFAFTADYFLIDVSGRISLTQDLRLEPGEVQRLLAEGIADAANVRDFRFFTNDFDTRTQGIDVVATYEPEFVEHTTFTFLFNHTTTRVTKSSPEIIDARRILELEKSLPRNRWNLSATHAPGRWRLLARMNYFGGWYDSEDVRFNDGGPTLDMEASYMFNDVAGVAVGGQNVLNKFPDRNPDAAVVGNPYSQYSPYGFNGAFFYARINYGWRW